MRGITVLWLGLAFMVAGGCGKKDEASSGQPESAAAAETPQATYAWIEKNVLQPKCLDCHSAQKARGEVVLGSYHEVMATVVPGDLENSPLWVEVKNGTMPKDRGRLPEAHVAAIKQWILDGAKSQ